MKKVLLVTLQGANIGNRLQNYALQEIIKKGNNIVYTPYYNVLEYDSVLKRLKVRIQCALSQIGFVRYSGIRNTRLREIKFSKFNESYIDNMFKVSFNHVPSEFDYAVTGSDQVWHNWSGDDSELNYFYLKFMPDEKRISYAASFGFEVFPQKDIDKHKEGLMGVRYLSCREEHGRKLIKELVGRDAELTLDPTLLLNKDEWIKIEKNPNYSTDNYILVYFLGEKTDESISTIKRIAEEKSLRVIDIYDANNLDYYLTTPDEFIWLIHHASYVCTNSYHACVFSILFNKKFLAFHRKGAGMENMFDRIRTLFDIFGIDREYHGEYSDIYKEYFANDITGLKKRSNTFILNVINDGY